MANLELAVQNCQGQLIPVEKGTTKKAAVSAMKDNNNISSNMEDSRRDEWSTDAINNLLDVYETKWNHRNRGNLKGGDWEDVATRVSARGGGGKSAKSPFQCKNKVASMKQKYRSETLLQGINGSNTSRWPFFGRMDVMLRVRSPNPQPIQTVVPDLRQQGGLQSGDSEQEVFRIGGSGGGGTVGAGGGNDGVLLSNGVEHHRVRIGGGGGGNGGGLLSNGEEHRMRIGGGGAPLFNEEEQQRTRFGGAPCNGEQHQHRTESHSKNNDGNNNNNEHHHDNNSEDNGEGEEGNGNGDADNQNDDASNTLPHRKPLGESDDTSTPRSKSAHLQATVVGGGINKSIIKYKKYLSKEVAASIRSFADSIMKLERAKMEMLKDSERIRAEMEARRVDMELKRTEIIMNTQLEIAKLLSGKTKKKKLKKKSGGTIAVTGTSTTSASTDIAAIATQHEVSAGPSAAAAGISSSPSRNGVSQSSMLIPPPPPVAATPGTSHPRPLHHHFLPTTVPVSLLRPSLIKRMFVT
ncbi:hypothetical protein SUGI_0240810 [Cryptomeria japonica]|nr:hypothetical protein SUGI_0240810 [Cryptomeria japonica]